MALFDGNRAGLGWEELVDLAQHAALGDQFVLRWACWQDCSCMRRCQLGSPRNWTGDFRRCPLLFCRRFASCTKHAAVSPELVVALHKHSSICLRPPTNRRLCEQLLFRLPPAPSSSGGSGEEVSSAGMAFSEKRLLLKYVHVLTDSLQRRQSETERRLQELERWQRQRGGGGRAGSSGSLPDADGGGRGGKGRLRRLARHPACIVFCMYATVALPPWHVASRLFQVLPLLALLPPPAN